VPEGQRHRELHLAQGGQADTVAHKVEICTRAYRLRVDLVGFPPQDIVFDPNIFAIGTGFKEHAEYAMTYFEATRSIKATLTHAKISGGVSNVSFSFRGDNPLREAIHAVLLYQGIRAGMDLGRVNAGAVVPNEDIPSDLRERVEDLMLSRRSDTTERLMKVAHQVKGRAKRGVAWRGAGCPWRSAFR
jgi:5-methyltetrahydrofolate--homocysteine methyltransferase